MLVELQPVLRVINGDLIRAEPKRDRIEPGVEIIGGGVTDAPTLPSFANLLPGWYLQFQISQFWHFWSRLEFKKSTKKICLVVH